MENYWTPIEAQWGSEHGLELQDAQRLCAKAHELVAWIAQHDDFVKRPASTLVTVQRLLVRRLGEELRGVELLAIHGHGFQAISAAANLFEQSHFLTFAASSESNAEKYLNADNMSKSTATVRDVVSIAGKQYGWAQERIDQEYKKYRFLCAFKHNNAAVHRLLRLSQDADVILGRLALADSLWCVLTSVGMLTVWAFPAKTMMQTMERCNPLMDATRRLYSNLEDHCTR